MTQIEDSVDGLKKTKKTILPKKNQNTENTDSWKEMRRSNKNVAISYEIFTLRGFFSGILLD